MLFHSLQGSLFPVCTATENSRPPSIIFLRGEKRGDLKNKREKKDKEEKRRREEKRQKAEMRGNQKPCKGRGRKENEKASRGEEAIRENKLNKMERREIKRERVQSKG